MESPYKARGAHDYCLSKYSHFPDSETNGHVMTVLSSRWVSVLPGHSLYPAPASYGGTGGMSDNVAKSNRGLAFQGLAWKPGPAVNHPGVASGVAAVLLTHLYGEYHLPLLHHFRFLA